MDTMYTVYLAPARADARAARPGTIDVPNGYLTEAQALAAAFRALSCGFSVSRIERPDGTELFAGDIEHRYRHTRG